mgnify:CR=1 FL=1
MAPRPTQLPAIEEIDSPGDRGALRFRHPAYGTVEVSHPQGGSDVYFGSRIEHQSRVRVTINAGSLKRGLSNDWIHSEKLLVELEFTDAQWSQFVSSHSGRATPCTFRHYPKGALNVELEAVPGIAGDPDARPSFSDEMQETMRKEIAGLQDAVKRMDAMLESGKLGKKELQEIRNSVARGADRVASNVGFVAEQFTEHMEQVVSDARIEIEANMHNTIQTIGLDAVKRMRELSALGSEA